ncbi:ATP-binding protein [Achromobacter ruhlandii]|uniref:ATP-binding protein n=1 Tax=Achromobacter ruhlandii TaxID=72557 RepID=UPI001467EB68|nr:sensor histidine kinase [Achromobacter ruhlandii]CAB3921834.1 Adaptive-response sensory-kinase SasA [Achromobacter ruhlandii]
MTSPRAPGSLRWRMLAGTLAWIAAIVVLAGWGLGNLFRQHITEQLRTELALHMNQLTAAVSVAPDGRPTVASPLSDPRLEQPLSGLYWQIDRLDDSGRVVAAGVARSRSLWDQVLALPAVDDADGLYDIAGPENHRLSALTRLLKPEDSDAGSLRLVVAADRAVLAEPIERFDHMLLWSLGALAAGMVVAAVVQVAVGLRPLGRLRRQLAAQQGRNSVRIEGRFPSEIQPLVDDFNRVLAVNADIVQRARTQAGNLAHAVKTPLTILGNAAAREEGAFARLVREQVAMAQRQIDHHLARARAAAASGTAGGRTPLRAPLQALLRVMQRLYAARGLALEMDEFSDRLEFRGEEQDLQEMVGNLLDNACKWAARRVRIGAQADAPDRLRIVIDDDGPGISEDERERIFERGVRMDEQHPGSGLGLDIVRDLAGTYGGEVSAGQSPLGGLRVTLILPALPTGA